MFASPDGLDGVDAKMLVLVSRVVTLNMATVFKNVKSFFPSDQQSATKAMLDSYIMGVPSMIYLHKDGLPFF